MRNLPNLISLMRLLLVPFTVWLILSGAFGWAFATFLIAGVSDGIDGYLARRFDWRTRLGAYLDPLADKALVVSVFVTLGFLKVIPAWLVIIVVSQMFVLIATQVVIFFPLFKCLWQCYLFPEHPRLPENGAPIRQRIGVRVDKQLDIGCEKGTGQFVFFPKK